MSELEPELDDDVDACAGCGGPFASEAEDVWDAAESGAPMVELDADGDGSVCPGVGELSWAVSRWRAGLDSERPMANEDVFDEELMQVWALGLALAVRTGRSGDGPCGDSSLVFARPPSTSGEVLPIPFLYEVDVVWERLQ